MKMKTLDEYLRMPYRMEIVPDPDEGDLLHRTLNSQAAFLPARQLRKRQRMLWMQKTQWLKAAYEDGVAINVPDSEKEYSGQFKLRMPKTLHRLLAEKSKQEGISMNQYCLFLLSRTAIL